MRALVQRVSRASVSVDAQRFASINKGLVIFLAIGKHDSASDVSYVVKKISNLRIFPNSDGKFDISALEVKAELLVISQFTLFAETRRGRRPSFTMAAEPKAAKELFQSAVDHLKSLQLITKTGVFQEKMSVDLVNEGPVTIWIDSSDKDLPRA